MSRAYNARRVAAHRFSTHITLYMAFGQQRTHGRRGRPPKDPSARAAAQRHLMSTEDFDESSSRHTRTSPPAAPASLASGFASLKSRKIHADDQPSSSMLQSDSSQQTVEEFESLLQEMRSRYEQSVDERVQQVRAIVSM